MIVVKQIKEQLHSIIVQLPPEEQAILSQSNFQITLIVVLQQNRW
jgi:hypothetical protein